MYRQHGSDFAQAEFPRISQPNYGAISGRQARHFLAQNRRALVLREQAVGGVFSRCGNHAFEITAIFIRRTIRCESRAPGARVAPHCVQHLSPNAKLRVSCQRCSILRTKRSRCLKKTKISRLNQIRHFNTGITGKPRQNSGCQYPHEPVHLLRRFLGMRRGFRSIVRSIFRGPFGAPCVGFWHL